MIELRPYEDARDAVLASLTPLSGETLSLPDAGGRWLASDLTAVLDLPPFDNSGMDGWAVRCGDLVGVPARLKVAGRMAAGDAEVPAIGAGEAIRIFTGAPLPPGADAVVMQEDAVLDPSEPGTVGIAERPKPWENIRFRGEDIRSGTLLLARGTRLGAAQIALLAAQGIATVPVGRRPRVAILPTGSELRRPGDPAPAGPGTIFESNGVMVASLVASAGGLPTLHAPVPDEPGALRTALERALAESDLVVTAGGASVGELDLVQDGFRALGGTIDLWRLAMKPGKPFFFGRAGSGRLCGLPGNPVSAFVTAVLLVLPALRRLQGAADPLPRPDFAVLGEALGNPGNRRHFVRVATGPDGRVRSSGIQGSHHLASLATADGLVDVPPGGSLAAGTCVPVIRWD